MAALPMVAPSPLNARSPVAAPSPCWLLPLSISSRVHNQCSSPAPGSWSNSAGSRMRCCSSSTRVVFPPLPAFDFQVVIEEDDDIEELTFLNDVSDESGSKGSSSKWLTPEYLSLRLRCSSLMTKEASDALSRHFKGRAPPPKKDSNPDESSGIRIKPAQTHHKQLHLIRERFEPLEFIRDVVIGDIQESFFQDLTAVSLEASE